jgi:starch-binding outer membrane protein, SusD/RagB family
MIITMKNKFILAAATAAMLAFGSACNITEVENIPDLNNPTVESVLANATRVQVRQLGVGLQASMRNGYFDISSMGGSVGRECIIFNKTDNRYYTELQGQVDIDPGGIFLPWHIATTSTRRRAEIFLRSSSNSTALSDEEKKACEGFAKTVQAFVMLNNLNMFKDVGIRTEFNDLLSEGDLLNPGPYVDYAAGLNYLQGLVDQGATALDAGGAAFPFPMASGWAGFNTPANFKKFNRAVAARIAMYKSDWAGMNTALNASFLDVAGDITTGPKFNFSTTSNDVANPFFLPLDEPNRPLVPQNAFVADAEAGDTRVFGTSIREGGTAKIRQRTAVVTLGGFPEVAYEHQQYATNTASASIIRNEELILMSAEAKAQTGDLAGAEAALDKIRTSHGLAALATAKPSTVGNKDLLIDEVLNQRRYSLFMEGSQRWFDMRRYNRLSQLPLDLPTHRVFTSFPKPQSEVDWDNQ